MNPQEKQLIEDVFNRLASVAGGAKDQAADQLIRDALRKLPDAPYYLVQTVIVQAQGLERAEERIRELEETLSRMQHRESVPSGSGSFLAGAQSPTRPVAASGPEEGPWSRAARPEEAGGRSAGFLSSALSTASGVAGGVFIADAIRSLFGGGTRESEAKASDQAAIDRAQDDAQDAEDEAVEAKRQLASDDAALDEDQDADDHGWSDDDGIDV
jgi:hypothetical protein